MISPNKANNDSQTVELDMSFEDPTVNIHLSKANSMDYLRFAIKVKRFVASGKVLNWGTGRG